MSTLNFALTRTAARELRRGDEIVVTRLDHDANVSPWLEVAHDLGVVVRFADIREDTSVDLDDLARLLGPRTKVVAFPVAANSVGTLTDVRRIVELAHEAGALAWADAVHYAPHGPIDVEGWASTSSSALRTSSSARIWGWRSPAGSCSSAGGPTRCGRPRPIRRGDASRPARCSTSCSRASSRPSSTWSRSAGTRSARTSARSGSGSSTASRMRTCAHGLPTMDGRVSTFAFTHAERTPREIAAGLGDRGVGVWWGDYYAIEVMKRLALPDGAVRVGIVHYNTEAEVDRLLEALSDF